jgi:hypothetical protein
MTHMESLWPRLAGQSLVVESCGYDRLHAVLAQESAQTLQRYARACAVITTCWLRKSGVRSVSSATLSGSAYTVGTSDASEQGWLAATTRGCATAKRDAVRS